MDLFDLVFHEFTQIPHAHSWPEAKDLFQVAASRKPEHWRIPARSCEAVGAAQEQAIPAIVAIGCAHVGLLLIDDMLDEDPRGDHCRLGMPAASNLACFFQSAALQAAARSVQDPASLAAAWKHVNEMFLSTSFGQFLDVQSPSSESKYWQVTRTKSSPFFGIALQLGALAGGAALETAQGLQELGCLYGEMIQIHDDMHDCMETPANPDWAQGRSPLPILFASLVPHPERARFIDLKKQSNSPDALYEAQQILIRCGAISYCADQLIQRYEAAMKILSRIPLTNSTPISTLFEAMILPVDKLLESFE